MSNDFDPLTDYTPADIPVEDIKTASLSETEKEQILSDINSAIKGSENVKDVLAVLVSAGKLTMAIGLKVLKNST